MSADVRVTRAGAARSALWSALENGGLAVVSFVSLIIYARFLSPTEFGTFATILGLVELLGVLVNMAFHDVLVQKQDVGREHYGTAFLATLALSALLCAGCLVLAPALGRMTGDDQAAMVLLWMSLSLPAFALGAATVAHERRALAFRSLAVRSLAGRLFGAALGIGLVLAGVGIWALVAQQVAVALASSVVLLLTARERPPLLFRWSALRSMLGFGAAAVGALFLHFAIKRLFVVISGLELGSEAAGFLNLGFRVVDTFWALSTAAIIQVALPILSRLQADEARLKRAYQSAVELVCLVLFPCFAGIALLSTEITELMFGARWLSSAGCMTALALVALVRSPRVLIAPLLTAVGKPRLFLYSLVVELAVVLSLSWFIPRGALSVAIGIWLLREALAVPITFKLLRDATGLGLAQQLSGAWTPFVAASGMAASVLALREFLPAGLHVGARAALLTVAGGVAYLALIRVVDRALLARAMSFVALKKADAPGAGGATTQANG